MNNKNSFMGEVTVRRNGYQDKPIKGAIGYTLPTKPTQALSLMKEQIDREISNEIMFTPFPQIRNVIVTFMKPYPIIQKDYSQILASEYQRNRLFQKLDISMNSNISKAYHQKIKLQKIFKCFQRAQQLKKTVIQLKNKIQGSRQDNLSMRIKQIQSQFDLKLRSLSKDNQKERTENELKKNQKIIEEFQAHHVQYEKKNNDFIKLDFTFNEIIEFCKEMQKIIPIIYRYEGISDSKEDIKTQNFIEYFQLTIKQQKSPLIKFIHQSQVELQLYRNKIKSQSWVWSEDSQQFKSHENQLKEMNLMYEKCYENIKLKVYQKLKQISKIDQHIVRNISNQISSNMNNYKKFVQTYTDIKEVVNTKNKLKDFYRIIIEEEKFISDHMRLNCGLVVYYKPTQEFQQFSRALHKRTYVEQIFIKRITPLNDAIKFINQEYSIMYKRACEDQKSGSKLRKNQVERKLIMLNQNLLALKNQENSLEPGEQNHFQYLTHLIVSLERLMSLAK